MQIKRHYLAIPYMLFLAIFVLLPLFVVLYYAFTGGDGHFTLMNFLNFFTNTKTIGTLFYSLLIAVVTTLICLLIAYPTAYLLARGPFTHGGALILLVAMPMWINFTLRLTAVREILTFLEGNMAYHPFLNTIIGMTYDFLPFMVLPLYNCITKMDGQLLEAAYDLGAGRRQVFFRVMIPLSMPGIVSGIIMVFLPSMTNYVVLDMVYNSTYIMGGLIGSYFSSYDWNNGAMISTILLLVIVLLSVLSNRLSGEGELERGGIV